MSSSIVYLIVYLLVYTNALVAGRDGLHDAPLAVGEVAELADGGGVRDAMGLPHGDGREEDARVDHLHHQGVHLPVVGVANGRYEWALRRPTHAR